jgi:sialic acid synthase SpsE
VAGKDRTGESGVSDVGIVIDSRRWGGGDRVMVVAELGVNHDGSVARAIELTEAAAVAGADAIKLQVFCADRLMNASAEFAAYQVGVTGSTPSTCSGQAGLPQANSPRDMLRRYELGDDDLRKIVGHARDLGLAVIATPFSPEDVARLVKLDLSAVKIASPDLVNWPLLRAAAAMGKPLLVSTGAATIDELRRSVAWLAQWHAMVALLHCVSAYPVGDEWAHVSWIRELATFGWAVGYSDHATDELAGALAVAAGAAVIEKHLTLDREAPGPDHAASADVAGFGRYVKLIRRAEKLMGHGAKRVLEIERDVRRVSRQSVVARRGIRAGAAIVEADVTVQRPGTGIGAAEFEGVIGRAVQRDIAAGTILTEAMFTAGAR